MPRKGIPDGLKAMFGMLPDGGDLSTNMPKSLGPLSRAKPTGDLLFDLHHPDLPLPLVIVKWHAAVCPKCPHLPFAGPQTDQQVPRGGWLRTTGLFAALSVAGTGTGLASTPAWTLAS